MREVLLPKTLDELWRCMERHPLAQVYAGGTDLLVKMHGGLLNPVALICLERIEELKGVAEHGGQIRIGSGVTCARLADEPAVREHLSVLRQAAMHLGSPPVRNMATIGGNICTASPAGDTLPPLYVLKAEVELRSEDGVRRMKIEEFITGPGATRFDPREILAAVWVKKPEGYNRQHFEKVGLRNALACSVVSFAALLGLAPDGTVEKAALAWGSTGPTVVTCPGAEEALLGGRLTPDRLRAAGSIVRESVAPISDVRADADYRRAVAGNLLLRLSEAWEEQREDGRERI
ncbi:MAG: xanthine dehydrogenase family protein subunit M [Syntrophobacteraceae bacterium]